MEHFGKIFTIRRKILLGMGVWGLFTREGMGRLIGIFMGLFLFALAGIEIPARGQVRSADEETVRLDPLLVRDHSEDTNYDATGMGAQEAELSEPPFSNDMIASSPEDAENVGEINMELGLIAMSSPADLVAGVSRINLRGFPTPRLRNGFTQSGVPEVINGSGGDRIQGPLTPVLGKAAPGGIENVMTARPRANAYRRVILSASSAQDRFADFEFNVPLVNKKAWHRLEVSWREKKGPEAFSYNRTRTISGAVTVKHSRAASTLFQVDYAEVKANPGSGVPEFRLSRTGRVMGPYRPLAYFHVNGPDAVINKRVASASVQFEGQPTKSISLRAGAQGFWRTIEDDRFTKGEYLLDEKVFAGTREPQHQDQDIKALVGQVDMTARFYALRADHKFMASLESSRVEYDRVHRGLDSTERAALPLSVRRFDPFNPDFFRPELGPDTYRRIIADRTETTGYTSAVLTERAALDRGRTVVALGLRYDMVDLVVEDRRVNAARPHIGDRTSELTWLGGVNYQLVPGRYLVFANASTAFEPSTRVDSRTNRLQGNETTSGLEGGIKTQLLARTMTATLLGFRYTNLNISRRNPLLDDPIADANQTQPQLVAAGEEQFTGASLNLRFAPGVNWIFSSLITYTRALTTASPDLPAEVGRQLSRLPSRTAVMSARYLIRDGKLKGISAGLTATYVGSYVYSYQDAVREYLVFPDYVLLTATGGYSWQRPKNKLSQSVGVSVRNLLDRDLVALLARPGQQRTLNVSYTAAF